MQEEETTESWLDMRARKKEKLRIISNLGHQVDGGTIAEKDTGAGASEEGGGWGLLLRTCGLEMLPGQASEDGDWGSKYTSLELRGEIQEGGQIWDYRQLLRQGSDATHQKANNCSLCDKITGDLYFIDYIFSKFLIIIFSGYYSYI